MAQNTNRPLKAYVRFDGTGRIVPSSLILRRKKPKVGKWVEIPAYECCNYIPTSTTTTTSSSTSTTTSTSTSTTSTTSTTTTAAPEACETLGRAGDFAVLAASTITNTGASVVTGDLGLYAGTSVTGFPPGTVVGTQHITDTEAQNAQTDALAAFTAFNLLAVDATLGADIGSTTINPGVYDFASSAAITGTVTLDGGGNADAVFVFLIPSTFIPATSAIVALINGAQAGNVYWIVGSSATLSTSSVINGNIIAQTSVTLDTSAGLVGRAFALTGAVTLDTNTVNAVEAPCTINPIA